MVDPLDIVNEFTTIDQEAYQAGVEPLAIHGVSGEYWLKKLCKLAERCAKAENEWKVLRKANPNRK